jgi:hypothetical protein
MPIVTGTHTIADLASNQFATELVMPGNVDAMNEAIQRDLATHNARVTEMMSDLAEQTTERSTAYGVNRSTEMHQADEFTRGPTQKVQAVAKVEFPLDKHQHAVGWTSDYLRRATVQDMARKTIAARQAHVRALQRGVRGALFLPTNYTWLDRFRDQLDLSVRRLVNGDGQPIPDGPNGEVFDPATHTHYLANSTLTATALNEAVQHVVEHGHGNDVRIYINRAQEATVRGLAGFAPLLVPNVVAAPGGTALIGQGTLDTSRADNRLIGYFEGFPVYTKPWIFANYVLVFAAGDAGKPLRMRVSDVPGEQGLFLAGEIAAFPLQARYMEAFFGFGAYTRTNAAILYIGGGSYVAPTIS